MMAPIETRYEAFTAAVLRHKFRTVRECRAWAKVASRATKRLVYWSYIKGQGVEEVAAVILLNACRKKWRKTDEPKYKQLKLDFDND